MEFKYEVWYDHCCVGSDSGFETEEEAYEEAKESVAFLMEDWNDPDITEDDFDVRVYEEETWGLYTEEEE